MRIGLGSVSRAPVHPPVLSSNATNACLGHRFFRYVQSGRWLLPYAGHGDHVPEIGHNKWIERNIQIVEKSDY